MKHLRALPNGKLFVTDGPYAETKEVLGGLFVRQAEKADHAISKPLGVRPGASELRPIDEDQHRWLSPRSE